MIKPSNESEERVFTIADLQKLFLRQKKTFFSMAMCGAVFAFGLALILHSPSYEIKATFKESSEKTSSASGNLLLALGGANAISEPQLTFLISSHNVLRPLISRLGMQAQIHTGKINLLKNGLCRIRDNLLAEMGCSLHDIDRFAFENVHYDGEQNLSYGLRFEDPTHFSVLQGSKVLTHGLLQQEICLPGASFTLIKTPSNLLLKKSYKLNISPWTDCVKKIHSRLLIKHHKENKSVHFIQISDRDRHAGTQFLNELMAEYRNYLKRDHDQIAVEQLIHLEQKQAAVYGQLSSTFNEYKKYLQQNLNQQGFLGLKEELNTFATLSQELSGKLLCIDGKLSLFNAMEQGQNALFTSSDDPFFCSAQTVVQELRDLQQERDLLELSLRDDCFKKPHYDASRWEELKKLQERRESVQQLLSSAQQDSGLLANANETKMPEGPAIDESAYLEHLLRLLKVQEQIVQSQLFYEHPSAAIFKGIDPQTLQSLLEKSHHTLTASEISLRHFDELGKQLLDDEFDLSSLSSVLTDAASVQLIQQANDIALKLRDQQHYSEKECARWKEEFAFKKKVLADHISQLAKLAQLNASANQMQITELQKARLASVNEKISVLHEWIHDAVQEYAQILSNEKESIKKTLTQLRNAFTHLPEKWQKEKWLDLQTELATKTIKALSELVGTKTIERDLHYIESKPLELAIPPHIPTPPHLLTIALFGGCLACFGSLFRSFLNATFHGFPSSKEKLQALGYPLLGEINADCDGPSVESVMGSDLELFRRINLFFDTNLKTHVVGLIAGQGPDYSYALAEHLAKMSRRTLIIRCDFQSKFHPKDLPGLVQILEGTVKDLPIRKKLGYDYLTAGGFTLYGAELIQSPAFAHLISECQKQYDVIFLLLRSPLQCAESLGVLRLCHQAIVTVCEEPTEQLMPFIDWAYHENSCRLKFVTSLTKAANK